MIEDAIEELKGALELLRALEPGVEASSHAARGVVIEAKTYVGLAYTFLGAALLVPEVPS